VPHITYIEQTEPVLRAEHGEKHLPAFVLAFGPTNTIFVQCPNMVRDMLTDKNNLIDKVGVEKALIKPLLGEGLIFAKGDKDWKYKRTVCSQAFYKDTIKSMAETFKQVAYGKVQEMNEIFAKDGANAKVNLMNTSGDIYCKIIFLILFGEDISDTPVTLNMFGKDERMTLNLSLGHIGQMCYGRIAHPLRIFFPYFYDKPVNAQERRNNADIANIRAIVEEFVDQRRQGKSKSKLAGGKDLLDYLLEDKKCFAERPEEIID